MAKKRSQKIDSVNPVHSPDPRFDPMSDTDNAMAHRMDLMGAEINEFDVELPAPNADDTPESDVQDVVTRSIEQAIQHYEENLEQDQADATDYYWSRPFGDEEDGRSKVVSSDVRDATQFQIASLLDVFCGPERVVEYRPKFAEDDAVARQATDYANLIFMEDNNGFLVLDSAFKDALVRRVGVIKWWKEDFYRTKGEKYSGLSQDNLYTLASDPEVDLDVSSFEKAEDGTYSVSVTRKEKHACFKVCCVPPEEVAWTPNARGIDDIPLFVHHGERPIDEVIGLVGEEHADYVKSVAGEKKRSKTDQSLAAARQYHDGDSWMSKEDDRAKALKPVIYAEAYAMVDADDDGTAELRFMQCVGPEFRIMNGDGMGEIVDEVPFALFTPDPEPHAIVGMSNYDLLKDIQKIKSQSLRAGMDSLSLATQPQLEVVTGEVNMADVLNPEVGNIIRVRRPGMLREIKHTSAVPDVLELVGYMDSVKEDRTGTSRAAMGLDADALQSSTKLAVSGTLSMAQRRVKYIARVFAETGMKRLFRGLLKLIVRHQDRPRVVRLRGEYVEIDPRSWDATMDVSINLGLGAGTTEEKLAALEKIALDQNEQFVNGSPLVSLTEIRNTRARFVELLGFRNSAEFYKPWGPEQQQQYEQSKANQSQQPDPNMALVEVEKMKAEMAAQMDAAKFHLDKWKAEMQEDRERDKLARDTILREKELEMKYQTQINEQALNAEIERDRMQLDADVKRAQAEASAQGKQITIRREQAVA